MRVCVVGGGGREHALASVLARTAEVVVTPGNPGIAGSTSVPPDELAADLFVIGPEASLVDGLADRLRATGALVFGPGADGARLEGSKAWMKEVCASAGVPTARHGAFTDIEPALAFLRTLPAPWVVKTDGLTAGKGVLVTESLAEAVDDVRSKLSGASFGAAGKRVVIEEGMTGEELSLFFVCDGARAVRLAPARDYKRIGDGDVGPNTGGMGAVSPVPGVGDDLVEDVLVKMVEPTLSHLRSIGVDYRGALYAGLMLTEEGPKLVEYNVRFGDPEAQVVLPRIAGDLAELLAAAAGGRLGEAPSFADDAAVTVVMASEGYPVQPRTGDPIEGLDDVPAGVTVFHAGTARDGRGIVTAGGRVLAVTGVAGSITAARDLAYEGVGRISWPGAQWRTDIAEGM